MNARGGAREGAGRKQKGPEKLSRPLRVLLTEKDWGRLERDAEGRNSTPSEMARAFILRGLALEKKRKDKG